MTTKEIFDKRYLYYRYGLNKPAIPLEARKLIFDVIEEYHQSKVNNFVLDDVSQQRELLNEFIEHCNDQLAVEDHFTKEWVDDYLGGI